MVAIGKDDRVRCKMIPDSQDPIPVACEDDDNARTVPYVIMGIPVQSFEQRQKISRMLYIAVLWMLLVSVDHTANINYSSVNGRDLHLCRQIQARSQGRSYETDYDNYSRITVVAYIISWGVALLIPCIGYTGAKRRRRGHINVFRVFGGCFAGVSVLVAIDNISAAVSSASLSEANFDRMHESCRRLAQDAKVSYLIFGIISLLLACTQFAAFVVANRVYNDYEFWTSSVQNGIAPAPVSLRRDQLNDSEAQTRRVPFARIEITQPSPRNLRPLHGRLRSAVVVPSHDEHDAEDLHLQSGNKRNDQHEDDNTIPTAKEVVAPPPKQMSPLRRLSDSFRS